MVTIYEKRGIRKGKKAGREEGREEGRGEGILEGCRKIAKKLLANGMTLKEVAKITGLTETELLKDES